MKPPISDLRFRNYRNLDHKLRITQPWTVAPLRCGFHLNNNHILPEIINFDQSYKPIGSNKPEKYFGSETVIGKAIRKENLKLAMNNSPILTFTGPFFCNIHHSQIEHFQKTFVGREDGFGFCDFP